MQKRRIRHLDLFSGIGGFALAAEMAWGKENVEHTFCDNEPFAQAILKKHWPDSVIYDDIKELRTPPSADIVTGGFPCQPFSAAGKRRGTEDDRHLWPEMLRVIRLSAPRWVIGENVGGLLNWNGGMVLDQVCTDLESLGYEVWPFVLPAAGVGAPHLRKRVWIVAQNTERKRGLNGKSKEPRNIRNERNIVARDEIGLHPQEDTPASDSSGIGHGGRNNKKRGTAQRQFLAGEQEGRAVRHQTERRSGDVADSHALGLRRHERTSTEKRTTARGGPPRAGWEQPWPEVAARLCTLDDGLPGGLARPRGWRNAALKGAGNAIVPQVAAEIMMMIQKIDPLI